MAVFVWIGSFGLCFSLQIYANILTRAMAQGKKDTDGMNNPMDQCHPCSEQSLFHHQFLRPRGRGGGEGHEVGTGGKGGKVN